MRKATVSRKTAETDITLSLELDGKGFGRIDTGVGFLDHMLTLFASHGQFDLEVSCIGDTGVDDHHSVEDIGIALGKAFYQALGEKRGICRYGDTVLPMDETLVLTSVDFSGRAFLDYELNVPAEKVGTFDTELCEEFWWGFVREANCALHLRKLTGRNSHHILEASFKSAARSLRKAVKIDPELIDRIPSTKGVL